MGTEKIAIVDYGSGNLRSVEKALLRVAERRGGSAEIIVTSDPQVVGNADRIVLPGVGAFADCMDGLNGIAGMRATLDDAVLARAVPFLGICVGMQLLASVGREFGDHEGLGWIEGEVVRMSPADASLKIPHMGWNDLRALRPHPLLADVGEDANVYFVHSYAFKPRDVSDVIATTDYGGAIVAAVARGNIAGVQFHPEKSQAAGLQILDNFLGWTP